MHVIKRYKHAIMGAGRWDCAWETVEALGINFLNDIEASLNITLADRLSALP